MTDRPGVARLSLRQVVLACLLWAVCVSAWSHFPSGYDLRVAHFARADGGLHLYLRLTMPLVVADAIGPVDSTGFATAPPFTVRRIESSHAFYFPDIERLRREPAMFSKLVSDAHLLRVDGHILSAKPLGLRVYPQGTVPPFHSRAEARAATAPGASYTEGGKEVDVAYVIADMHYFYPYAGDISSFSLASRSDSGTLGQPQIQNLVMDHLDGQTRVYRRVGALAQPLEVNQSVWRAASSFTLNGMAHIIGGADHLLFILCITLGARSLAVLMWRVTAFTFGHLLSLNYGFFGQLPTGEWFIPAVEAAIALSIVLAALSLLRHKDHRFGGVLAITAIGLVHGLGFAFGLRELLDVRELHGLISFAAFNLGIEIGQALFAGVVFYGVGWLQSRSTHLRSRVEQALAIGSSAVALLWLIERCQMLLP